MRPLSTALSTLSTLALITSFACSGESSEIDGEDDCFTCDGKADAAGVPENSCEARAVLDFVSAATLETLDDDVGLDVRAAEGIVSHGNFATLAELDAIPFVGPVAFRRITSYAILNGFVDCADPLTCGDIEGSIDECQGLHNETFDECVAGNFTYDELETCCAEDDVLFFCDEMELIELTQNDPNTEFIETFLALQEQATGDCLPFGAAFSYEVEEPSRYATAKSIAADFGIAGGSIEVGTSAADLDSFLDSFGFDVGGLEGAIGFADYDLARVTGDEIDVMILHYQARNEVWTVALDCSL